MGEAAELELVVVEIEGNGVGEAEGTVVGAGMKIMFAGSAPRRKSLWLVGHTPRERLESESTFFTK